MKLQGRRQSSNIEDSTKAPKSNGLPGQFGRVLGDVLQGYAEMGKAFTAGITNDLGISAMHQPNPALSGGTPDQTLEESLKSFQNIWRSPNAISEYRMTTPSTEMKFGKDGKAIGWQNGVDYRKGGQFLPDAVVESLTNGKIKNYSGRPDINKKEKSIPMTSADPTIGTGVLEDFQEAKLITGIHELLQAGK